MSAARRRHARQGRPPQTHPVAASSVPRTPPVHGTRVFLVPLTFTTALFLVSFVPRVASHPVLTRSFWAATAVLLAWQLVLFLRTSVGATGPSLPLTAPRAQHYVQTLCQLTVYAYWGWYWPPVYDYAWLLIGQLVFAYAFDLLLGWSRRGSYILGFGPFPIILSTNLFMWFRDEWFYLQFVMIAVGFMGKEFVRWQREGTTKHIFNPSAFSLGLFSLVLIATGTTQLTWGQEIATTLSLGPRIYVVLFLVGLVVMYFFAITPVTVAAASALFGLSALYTASAGVPYFLDSEIPSAVFLGLHLLVTDPSTSPRTPRGKAVFGVLYGVGVFGLYELLGAFGAPTFYDKLLCVPLLNLSIQRIDRLVTAVAARPTVGVGPTAWAPARANLALMGAWVVFFGGMTAAGGTDGRHRGDSLPFWQQACTDGRRNACARLLQIESSYCGDNAGWACNELGGHYLAGTIAPTDRELALNYFSRACEGRFQPGCLNLLQPNGFVQADPRVLDLRLLLREGGMNLLDMPEAALYERACTHGWRFACERTARLR